MKSYVTNPKTEVHYNVSIANIAMTVIIIKPNAQMSTL